MSEINTTSKQLALRIEASVINLIERLDSAQAEITRLKAERAVIKPKRLCVLCGREADASEVPFRGTLPDCPEAIVDGENFGKLCMFDMTPDEAVNYWKKKWHEDNSKHRAELSTAREDALEEAAKVVDTNAMEQADRRDEVPPESEDWQVYNQAAFVLADAAAAIRNLKEKKDG